MKNNTLLPLLSEYFLSYIPDAKGLSKNTLVSYQYAFQLLFEFMNDKKGLPPEKVTFASLSNGIVTEYLNWLETERKCSAVTRNLRRTAIISFAKYAMQKNLSEGVSFYTEVNNSPKKKSQKNPEIKYFTKEEISILMSMPDTATKIGKRDTILLSVLYASGARAQELCDMTLNDIYFGDETNIRLVGKGRKARMITIPDSCATLLKNYLNSVNLDAASPQDRQRHVFSSQTHEKMTISCVEEIVKKYVAAAKTQYPHLFKKSNYSPHSFRHSIAVHMLECGESLVVIKAFLGHASISATVVYASVTPELANKYLRARGQILETIDMQQHKTGSLASSLPFLNKFMSKR